MRIFYLILALLTLVSIYLLFKKTHDSYNDKFQIEILIIPCFILALFSNNGLSLIEVLTKRVNEIIKIKIYYVLKGSMGFFYLFGSC